jgi:hypothetical protein
MQVKFGPMRYRSPSPVNPFGPVLLALIAAAVLGIVYWGFGVGKDAFRFAVAAVGIFAMPVVIVFGITGLVLGIRRLLRRKNMDGGPHEYPFGSPNEQNDYRIFPDDMLNDEHILYHGTAAIKLEPIINGGFKILGKPFNTDGKLPSVSFAWKSRTALIYACERRTPDSPQGCIIAVRFKNLESPLIVPDPVGITVFRQDEMPPVIGYCIVPSTYKHV